MQGDAYDTQDWGVGLNLTAADTVFIFEPWWNKAAEEQAINRLHRFGQKAKVLCFSLITQDTIEEKIQQLQQQSLSCSAHSSTATVHRQNNSAKKTSSSFRLNSHSIMADETLVKTEKIIDLSNQEAIIVSRDILSSHTITEIKYLVKYLLNSLNYIRYVAINENNHNYVPDVIKLCATKKQCLKAELLNFASLFSTKTTFTSSSRLYPIMCARYGLRQQTNLLSEKEANELLGEECVIDTHRWHQVGVCNTLGEGIFKITSSERFDYSDNNTYYLTFKSYWLRELTYRCSHHTLKDCQTAVLPDKLTVFNAEADLFQEIPILNNLRESGMLTLGRTHFYSETAQGFRQSPH